jgi:HdeA/HdeB family
MRPIVIVSAMVLCGAPFAMAQVTFDVSKITCDQYVHTITTPRMIGAWLSGYYNAKRDNHIIDVRNFNANLRKLEKFCYQEKNFNIPVMQAIEQSGAVK